MRKPSKRMEHSLNAAAKIRRRAHTVEHERVRRICFRRVIPMGAGVESNVRETATIKFREQRPKPIGMFVIDGDGLSKAHALFESPRTILIIAAALAP